MYYKFEDIFLMQDSMIKHSALFQATACTSDLAKVIPVTQTVENNVSRSISLMSLPTQYNIDCMVI